MIIDEKEPEDVEVSENDPVPEKTDIPPVTEKPKKKVTFAEHVEVITYEVPKALEEEEPEEMRGGDVIDRVTNAVYSVLEFILPIGDDLTFDQNNPLLN